MLVGGVKVEITMDESVLQPDLVHGQLSPPLGWFSTDFDVRHATNVLVWRGRVVGPTLLTTHINVLSDGG